MRKYSRIILMAVALAVHGGCRPPAPRPHLAHPDPTVKIPSIVRVADRDDLSAARQLVFELDSDDPAVRFFAIEALHRLTGQRLGYEYYHDEEQRRPAMQRWRQWLIQLQQQE